MTEKIIDLLRGQSQNTGATRSVFDHDSATLFSMLVETHQQGLDRTLAWPSCYTSPQTEVLGSNGGRPAGLLLSLLTLGLFSESRGEVAE
jgi:hypothetical protein